MAASQAIEDQRPNILVIVADDLGYSDLGAFGGEISTPNLDALAKRGTRLTGFYTTPACSPTRASLLTGRDNHQVGLGSMAEVLTPEQRGQPGYEGFLRQDTPTVAERLKRAGYTTIMSGKWHLGAKKGFTPAERGFEYSFALLQGAHNHFGMDQTKPYREAGAAPDYRLDGKAVAWPVGAYSSDYFTNKLINFLSASPKDRPFFAYLAFTAPHWPLQAPSATIAKYRGRYDKGPAALAESRIKRMAELDIVPANVAWRPIKDNWTSLPAEQRALETRKMEVYAAMVDCMDQNIGRVIDHLRQSGRLDNTIIMFMSDNGPEGLTFDSPINPSNPIKPIPAPLDNSLANLGAGNSYFSYGPQWGQAAAAPYWGTKEHTSEGGMHSPAIIAGPGIAGGRTSGALLHVTDVMPTALSIAGISEEGTDADLQGRDLTGLLRGAVPSVRGPDDVVNWELFYRRAVRRGNMKAVYQPTRVPVLGPQSKPGDTRWQLYDLARDPGETRDLAEEQPETLRDLVSLWHEYASRNGVVLLDDEERPGWAGGAEPLQQLRPQQTRQ